MPYGALWGYIRAFSLAGGSKWKKHGNEMERGYLRDEGKEKTMDYLLAAVYKAPIAMPPFPANSQQVMGAKNRNDN